MRRAWLPALICVLLGLSWQLLTVHYNYGGNLRFYRVESLH